MCSPTYLSLRMKSAYADLCMHMQTYVCICGLVQACVYCLLHACICGYMHYLHIRPCSKVCICWLYVCYVDSTLLAPPCSVLTRKGRSPIACNGGSCAGKLVQAGNASETVCQYAIERLEVCIVNKACKFISSTSFRRWS